MTKATLPLFLLLLSLLLLLLLLVGVVGVWPRLMKWKESELMAVLR